MQIALSFALAIVMIPVGFLAALVGIGGGTIIVPLLTLFFGLPIKEAVAISIVTVVAAGITGASRYLKQKITNIRLGLFLELSTTLGAMLGAVLALSLPSFILFFLLAVVLLYIGLNQLLRGKKEREMIMHQAYEEISEDIIARKLNLSGKYWDAAENSEIKYKVTNTLQGLLASIIAGLASGMLGIGGGVLKVPIMNDVMKIPVKVAVATSKFMMCLTASAAALVYINEGRVNLHLASATILGIMLGEFIGTRVMNRVHADKIKMLLGLVLTYLGYLMLARGVYQVSGLKLPGV
ncbi:MAG TPA: sulfite exporter TauE/SafE family protein [Euryarchaeota archaeon]|nr:sulfite exporter TauE/SafE family protein [Euryarchaeota archaeon]